MKIQDLKNNRNEIINQIKFQNIITSVEITKVMNYLLMWIENDKTLANKKATKKNISILTKDAIDIYFRIDFVAEDIDLAEMNRENARKNLPSSMR